MEQVMKENIAQLNNDNKQECLVHSRPLTPCIVPQAVERLALAAAAHHSIGRRRLQAVLGSNIGTSPALQFGQVRRRTL
jgi:hypothetical protein